MNEINLFSNPELYNKTKSSISEKEYIIEQCNLIKSIDVKSNLDKSLKNSLRRFNYDDIMFDTARARDSYCQLADSICKIFSEYPYRIKSIHSCKMKYLKYIEKESVPLNKVYNDILGFRIVVNDYPDLHELDNDFKVVRS